MDKKYCVYIVTNRYNTVLYTGVTNNLLRRIWEHKQKSTKCFSKKYNCDKLVYFEMFDDAYNAIQREKQIKAGSRRKKLALINNVNRDGKIYMEISRGSIPI